MATSPTLWRREGRALRRTLALTIAAAMAITTFAAVPFAPPAQASSGEPILRNGETLRAGQSLVAASRAYRLTVQSDGNVVIYNSSSKAVWTTKTSGNPGARLAMTSTGDLAVYATTNRVLWHSDTAGLGGKQVRMQSDGNLVIYMADGRATWSRGTGKTGNSTSTLAIGWTLKSGASLTSGDGAYQLIMQGDGNLVLYKTSGGAVWSTGTVGTSGAWLALQGDGNLVVYAPGNRAIWSSATVGLGGDRLILQGDGNLVLYLPGGRAVWSRAGGRTGNSTTTMAGGWSLGPDTALRASDGSHILYMQADGNLVVYRTSGGARWSSGTPGHPGAWAAMQTDGNFVVYAPGNRAIWSSGTNGNPGATVAIQPDGNAVVRSTDGAPKWSWMSGKIGSPSAGGVIGDDYPQPWRSGALDQYVDSWGYYSRECTSFVAWRLHSKNGFEMPRAIGNAGVWHNRFPGQTNSTPAVGAIAENNGHVAWVAAVNGNGTVTIEEYNVPLYSGRYNVRTVPASQFWYIHVKDL